MGHDLIVLIDALPVRLQLFEAEKRERNDQQRGKQFHLVLLMILST
jgi:hypothetical protein